MALHQYIGARYTPKFYVNSLDPTSCDWEANVTYEPLTVVTLPNDHCYISKKEVPNSVGTPASNEDYWLETGNFNAYIQDLQDQIDILDADVAQNTSDIATLMGSGNKHMVFVGDSFAVTGVQQQTAKYFGVADADAYYYGNTGAGYVTHNPVGAPYGDVTFSGLIDLAYNQVIADGLTANNIDYVVIYGGINDTSQTLADVETAANLCFANALTKFPKAKLIVGCNAGKAAIPYSYKQMIDAIYTYADMAGAKALRGIEHALYNMANLVQGDNIHPNNNGCAVIGYYIKSLYEGNDPFNRMYEYDVNNTAATGKVKVQVTKDIVTLTYTLTWNDANDANPQITLQERTVPAESVGAPAAINVTPPYMIVNSSGGMAMYGTKANGSTYYGMMSWMVGVA